MSAAGQGRGGRDYVYSVPWNLLLITGGSLLFSLAIKGIADPHGFVPAGLFGVSILIDRLVGAPGAGLWYLLFNLPLFAVAWLFIGRRFLLYSLWGMLVTATSYALLDVDFGIRDQLYAAVTCGALSGAGAGIVLRSLGSNGGLDVVGVILWQRWNIGLGKFYFVFNFLLFAASFLVLEIDLIIASLILVFVSSVAVEYCLSLFSQRKVAMIISPQSEAIADDILQKLKIGATFLEGRGAMARERKQVLLAVINNIQLKRLEQLVFTRDPHALMIVENTFMVIGSTFSRRKIY